MSVNVRHNNFGLCDAEFMWPEPGIESLTTEAAYLVFELSRVGWEVPGFDVEIDTYGELDAPMRIVRSVSGVTDDGPFRIRFGNSQGRRGDWNITTAVSETVVPPGIEIHTYSDDSGPTICLYTGKDWRRDGVGFMNSIKVNSKLNKEPKTYLKYSGKGRGGQVAYHDSDLDREYSPGLGQAKEVSIPALKEVTRTFIKSLIAKLEVLPSAPGRDIDKFGDANLRRICSQTSIPAPVGFPALYARVDFRQVAPLMPARDRKYYDDESTRKAAAAVVHGNGYRLAGFGVKGPLPERAHDGFDYASTDPMGSPGHVIYGPSSDGWPVIINLASLNDVFVVDNYEFERAREAYWAAVPESEREKHRAPDSALDDWAGATARTMVPAADYDGSYTNPVYAIGRILSEDEARPAVGRVRLVEDGDTVRAEIIDSKTGIVVPLVMPHGICQWALNNARRQCEYAAESISGNREDYERITVENDAVPSFGH